MPRLTAQDRLEGRAPPAQAMPGVPGLISAGSRRSRHDERVFHF